MRGRDDTGLDGLGQPLVDGDLYYVQDARAAVGNCASWWRANGAGYACDLDDAGVYYGSYVRGMRETDIPWPVAYVEARTIRHVRADSIKLGGDSHLHEPTEAQVDELARIITEGPPLDGPPVEFPVRVRAMARILWAMGARLRPATTDRR